MFARVCRGVPAGAARGKADAIARAAAASAAAVSPANPYHSTQSTSPLKNTRYHYRHHHHDKTKLTIASRPFFTSFSALAGLDMPAGSNGNELRKPEEPPLSFHPW